MRYDEIGRLLWIRGPGLLRSLDGDPMATEDEQVEIELARPPAFAVAAPERPLELLQGDEEGQRPGNRIGSPSHVESHATVRSTVQRWRPSRWEDSMLLRAMRGVMFRERSHRRRCS